MEGFEALKQNQNQQQNQNLQQNQQQNQQQNLQQNQQHGQVEAQNLNVQHEQERVQHDNIEQEKPAYADIISQYKLVSDTLLNYVYSEDNNGVSEELREFAGNLTALSVFLTGLSKAGEEARLSEQHITELKMYYAKVQKACNDYRQHREGAIDVLDQDISDKIQLISDRIDLDREGIDQVDVTKVWSLKSLFTEIRLEPFDTNGAEIAEEIGANTSKRLHIKKGDTEFAFTENAPVLSIKKALADARLKVPEGAAFFDMLELNPVCAGIARSLYPAYKASFEAAAEGNATKQQQDKIKEYFNMLKDMGGMNIDLEELLTKEEFIKNYAQITEDFSQGKHSDGSRVGAEIKPGRNLEMRNVGMTRVAELLGLSDRLAHSKTATITRNGVQKKGVVMEWINGATQEQLKNADWSDCKNVLMQLADLEVIDYICGNVDRHSKNLVFSIEGNKVTGVKGIDNDLAFGNIKGGAKNKHQLMSTPPNIQVMRKRTANMVMNLKKSELQLMLTGLIEPDEIEDAWSRTEALQAQIRESLNNKWTYINSVAAGMTRIMDDDDKMWDKTSIARLANSTFFTGEQNVYSRIENEYHTVKAQNGYMGIIPKERSEEIKSQTSRGKVTALLESNIPKGGKFGREQIAAGEQTGESLKYIDAERFASQLYRQMNVRDITDCVYIGSEKLKDVLKKDYGFKYEYGNRDKLAQFNAYYAALLLKSDKPMTLVFPQIGEDGRPELTTTDVSFDLTDATDEEREAYDRKRKAARRTRRKRFIAIKDKVDETMWSAWRSITGSKVQNDYKLSKMIKERRTRTLGTFLVPAKMGFEYETFRREGENIKDLDKDQKDLIADQLKEKKDNKSDLEKKARNNVRPVRFNADPVKALLEFDLPPLVTDKNIVDSYDKMRELKAVLNNLEGNTNEQLLKVMNRARLILRYAEARMKLIANPDYVSTTETALKHLNSKDLNALKGKSKRLKQDMEACKAALDAVKEIADADTPEEVQQRQERANARREKEQREAAQIEERRKAREDKLRGQIRSSVGNVLTDIQAEKELKTRPYVRSEVSEEQFEKAIRDIRRMDFGKLKLASQGDAVTQSAHNRKLLKKWRKLIDDFDTGMTYDSYLDGVSADDIICAEKNRRMLEQAESYFELALTVCTSKFYGTPEDVVDKQDPEWAGYDQKRRALLAHPLSSQKNWDEIGTGIEQTLRQEKEQDVERSRFFFRMGAVNALNTISEEQAMQYLEQKGMIEEFINDPANAALLEEWRGAGHDTPEKIRLMVTKELQSRSTGQSLKGERVEPDERLFVEKADTMQYFNADKYYIRLNSNRIKGQLMKEASSAAEYAANETRTKLEDYKQNGDPAVLASLVRTCLKTNATALAALMGTQPGTCLPLLKRVQILRGELKMIREHAHKTDLSADELASFTALCNYSVFAEELNVFELNYYDKGKFYFDINDVKMPAFYNSVNVFTSRMNATTGVKNPDYVLAGKIQADCVRLVNSRTKEMGDDGYEELYDKYLTSAEDQLLDEGEKSFDHMITDLDHDTRYEGETLFAHKDRLKSFLNNLIRNATAYRDKIGDDDEDAAAVKRKNLINYRIERLNLKLQEVNDLSPESLMVRLSRTDDMKLMDDLKKIKATLLRSSNDGNFAYKPEEFEGDKANVLQMYNTTIADLNKILDKLDGLDEVDEQKSQIRSLVDRRCAEAAWLQGLTYDRLKEIAQLKTVSDWSDLASGASEWENTKNLLTEKRNHTISEYTVLAHEENKEEEQKPVQQNAGVVQDVPMDPDAAKLIAKTNYENERIKTYKPDIETKKLAKALKDLCNKPDEEFEKLFQLHNGNWAAMLGKAKSEDETIKEIFSNAMNETTAKDMHEQFKFSGTVYSATIAELKITAEDCSIAAEFIDRLASDQNFADQMGLKDPELKAKFMEEYSKMDEVMYYMTTFNYVSNMMGTLSRLETRGLSDVKAKLIKRAKNQFAAQRASFINDYSTLTGEKWSNAIRRMYKFLNRAGVRIDFPKGDKMTDYSKRTDAFEKLADLENVSEVKVDGVSMKANADLKLPAEIKLKDGITPEQFKDLLEKHNIAASKFVLFNNAMQKKPLPDMSKLSEEDKKLAEKMKGGAELGLFGFSNVIRTGYHMDTMDELERKIRDAIA